LVFLSSVRFQSLGKAKMYMPAKTLLGTLGLRNIGFKKLFSKVMVFSNIGFKYSKCSRRLRRKCKLSHRQKKISQTTHTHTHTHTHTLITSLSCCFSGISLWSGHSGSAQSES
jgi:hypothetical protein